MSGRGRGSRGGGGRGEGGRGRGGGGGGGRSQGRGGGGGYQGGGEGRGGGRGGGGSARGGGGGGGFGGRGGAPRPDLSNIDKVLTNVLPAKLSETFAFYLYTINSTDKKDALIESRSRRFELFNLGWDSLFTDQQVKTELKRMVFFAGSFFFSAREIPGLEPTNLPRTLCDGSTTNGDTMSCDDVKRFTAPLVLMPSTPATIARGLNEVQFDASRCANCVKTFANYGELLQHCRDSGHVPIFGPSTGDADTDASRSVPASVEVFTAYVSSALERAMAERLTRWGREYVDRDAPIPALDRNGNDLGVSIFEAIALAFGIISVDGGPPTLALTCDLRAKVIRNVSVLDCINARGAKTSFTEQDRNRLNREWVGSVVIYKNDRKCYTVTGLEFNHSPNSLPVPSKGMSHAEYFKKKGVVLEYPNAKPMVAVEGRQKSTIYLPAELVMGNELDPRVREMLPQIASFTPEVRNQAVEKVKAFLQPGTQRGTGGSLLPAIGVFLGDKRIVAKAQVLPAPTLMAAGVTIPKHNAEHWAPVLGRANFNIDPKKAVQLNVVVFHHPHLHACAIQVYERIRDFLNNFHAQYRFGTRPYALVETGDNERHWGAFERYFAAKAPDNLFVLDFVKPRAALDSAYPVVKQMLAKSGYLSQFINFKTYSHDAPRDMKKSDMILGAVARQVLQKSGVRLWWSEIPKSLPLPAVFVGVDVFHAPMVYDQVNKKRGRKASCAAIIVQVIRQQTSGPPKMEIYSKTYSRSGGNEYQLGDALQETVANSLRLLNCEPKSVVVWRDGIAESAEHHAIEEINGVRRGLNSRTAVGTQSAGPSRNVPLAYIVCQKRIATKLLTSDGTYGAPSGTMVTALQGLQYQTFYINGRAPPYSTPKPVRFLCIQRDARLNSVPMGVLTWGQCHEYPNWAGPVKVPSVCQMAHKLAELAGAFADGGETINAEAYKNRVYFL